MAKIPMMKKVQQIRTLSALWKYRSQLFTMLRAMIRGSYKASFLTMVALIAGLLYILSPIDLIPDFIPVVGWLDDGAVMYFLLKRLMYEMQRYEAWKNPLKLISK
jgi:uncharacterized membrane protein YkvA (DUF1232 family)